MTGLLRWGYIKKQGSSRKTWKKRWFVLAAGIEGQEVTLKYYNSQKDTVVLGTVEISERTKIKRTADDRFEISTPQRIYFLITTTEQDCTEWVDILNYLIGERAIQGSLEDAPMLQFRGYLVTQTGLLKTYKQMYYVLDSRRICYYSDSTKTEPLGAFNLKDCSEVGLMNPGCFALVVSGKIKYFFSNDPTVLDNWVAVITNALDFCKNLRKGAPPLKQRGASLANQTGTSALSLAPAPPARTVSKPVQTTKPSRRKPYSEKEDLPFVEPGTEGTENTTVDPTADDSEPTETEPKEEAPGPDSSEEAVLRNGSAENKATQEEVRASQRSSFWTDFDDDETSSSWTDSTALSMYNDDEERKDEDDNDSEGEVIPEPPVTEKIPVGRVLPMMSVESVPVSPFVEAHTDMFNFFIMDSEYLWQSSEVPVTVGEGQIGVVGEEADNDEVELPPQIPESVRQSIYLDRVAMRSYSENLSHMTLDDASIAATEPEVPPVPLLLLPPVPAPRTRKNIPPPQDLPPPSEAPTNGVDLDASAPIPAPRPPKPLLRVPSVRAINSEGKQQRLGRKPTISIATKPKRTRPKPDPTPAE